jgi:hypothetical protein
MGSPVKLYQREMHDKLGFFATWLPGDPLEVGDVGVVEGGRFRKMTSLEELGIASTVADGEAMQDLQYTSSEGTKISTSAGAAVAPVAKAEITVEFSRQGAFVFHASSLQPRGLQNRAKVENGIVEAYQAARWQQEWLLVESLHTATRATIIVSEDQSAGLVLAASADTPIPGVSLADPKVGLTIASTRGRIVHIIGGVGMRPLYSCLRLKDSWLKGPKLKPVRGGRAESAAIPLSRPSIEELLNS